ncbi:MAG: DUF4129 domain-containing protein [Nocardioides sp.]
MTARRAPITAVVSVAAAVGLLLLLMTWASVTGPGEVFHGTTRDPSFLPSVGVPSQSTSTSPRTVRKLHLTHKEASRPASWPWLADVIHWVARLGALYVIYRLGRWLVEDLLARRRPRRRGEQVEFDVLDHPERLARQLREDADEAYLALLAGEPRNAIVACWDRFEQQAELVDAARKPWETSSEFTWRLLAAVSADAAAVGRLEALYREARFSTHPIDEGRRTRATEALRAIHLSLGAPTGGAGS